MPSTTAEQKKQLRKSVRSLLTALSPEERTAGDRAMFQAFLSLPEVRQTGTFFLFWGIAGLEPDTGSLAASLTKLGKTVCLPRVVPGFGMAGSTARSCPWPSPTSASRSPRSRPL